MKTKRFEVTVAQAVMEPDRTGPDGFYHFPNAPSWIHPVRTYVVRAPSIKLARAVAAAKYIMELCLEAWVPLHKRAWEV